MLCFWLLSIDSEEEDFNPSVSNTYIDQNKLKENNNRMNCKNVDENTFNIPFDCISHSFKVICRKQKALKPSEREREIAFFVSDLICLWNNIPKDSN